MALIVHQPARIPKPSYYSCSRRLEASPVVSRSFKPLLHPLPQERSPFKTPFHSAPPPRVHQKNPKSQQRERERERASHGFRRRFQGQGSCDGQPPRDTQAARRAGFLRRARGLLRTPPGHRPPPAQHPELGGQLLRRRRRRHQRRERARARGCRRRRPPPRPRHHRAQLLLSGRGRPVRRADEPGPAAGSGRRGVWPLLRGGVSSWARVVGGEGGRRRNVPEGADAGAAEGTREGAGGAEQPGDRGGGREGALGRRRRGRAQIQPPHRAARRRVQDGQDQGRDEERRALGHRAQGQGGGAQGRFPGAGRVRGETDRE